MEKRNDEILDLSAKETELTAVQEKVLEDLNDIFPNHDPAILQMSVRHSSNMVEPLDQVAVFQRCLDDVIEGRTAAYLYTRSGKSYKAPLTPVQRQVLSQLELLFPNMSNAQLRTTLLHRRNLCHSLHGDILLQRCMDSLLTDDFDDDGLYVSDGEAARDVVVTGSEPSKEVVITGCVPGDTVSAVAATSVSSPDDEPYVSDGEAARDVVVTGSEPSKEVVITGCVPGDTVSAVAATSVSSPDDEPYVSDGEAARDVVVTGAEPSKEVVITGCVPGDTVSAVAATSVSSPGLSVGNLTDPVETWVSDLEASLAADIQLLHTTVRDEETMDFDDTFDEAFRAVESNDIKKGTTAFDKYSTRTIELLDSDSDSLGVLSGRTTPENEDELPEITFPKTLAYHRGYAGDGPKASKHVTDESSAIDSPVSVGAAVKDKQMTDIGVKEDNKNNSPALSACRHSIYPHSGSTTSVPPAVYMYRSPIPGGSGVVTIPKRSISTTAAQTTLTSSSAKPVPEKQNSSQPLLDVNHTQSSVKSLYAINHKQDTAKSISASNLTKDSAKSLYATNHAQNRANLISKFNQMQNSAMSISTSNQIQNSAKSISTSNQMQNSAKSISTSNQMQNSAKSISTSNQMQNSAKSISVTSHTQNGAKSVYVTNQMQYVAKSVLALNKFQNRGKSISASSQMENSAKTLSASNQIQSGAKSLSVTSRTQNSQSTYLVNRKLDGPATIVPSSLPVTTGTPCKVKHCLCSHCLSKMQSSSDIPERVPTTAPASLVSVGKYNRLSDRPLVSVVASKHQLADISSQLPVKVAQDQLPKHTPHKEDSSKVKSDMKPPGDEVTNKKCDMLASASDNLREMLAAAHQLATANITPSAVGTKRNSQKTIANLGKRKAVGKTQTTVSNSITSNHMQGAHANGSNTTVTIKSTHKITYSNPSVKRQGNPNVQLPKGTVHGSPQNRGPAFVLPSPDVTLSFSGAKQDHTPILDVDLEIGPLSLGGDLEPTIVLDPAPPGAVDDPTPIVENADPIVVNADPFVNMNPIDVNADPIVRQHPAPVTLAPAPPPLTQEEIAENDRIAVKNGVLSLFADVESTYLDTLTRQYVGRDAVNNICNALLETKYPTAPKVSAAAEAASTSDVVATSSPLDVDWYDCSVNSDRWCSNQYCTQSRFLLLNEFEWLPAKFIHDVRSRLNYLHAPCHRVLCQVWEMAQKAASTPSSGAAMQTAKYRQLCFKVEFETPRGKYSPTVTLLKSRRPKMISVRNVDDYLLKEIEFVKMKSAEFKTAADRDVALAMNEHEYEDEGQLIECGCCYGEVPFENMVQCSDGHLFCLDCLKQYAQESIFGQGKADLSCMTDMCKSTFPTSQLVRALPSELLQRYDDRVQEESLNLADLGDLVRCPNCEFAALMDPSDKVFRCQNTKCMKETCRHCKEEWAEHFGKRCDEIEKKDETKLRLEYEEKMTKAKVRTCPRCKSQFMKEDGCNKMTCRCGAKMCYICRKPNIDYSHFCRHPRDPGKKCTLCEDCSLWTNADEDDNRAISELQKEAERVRKTQGYEDDKLIGAPAGSPPAKKAKKDNVRPPPLQLPL